MAIFLECWFISSNYCRSQFFRVHKIFANFTRPSPIAKILCSQKIEIRQIFSATSVSICTRAFAFTSVSIHLHRDLPVGLLASISILMPAPAPCSYTHEQNKTDIYKSQINNFRQKNLSCVCFANIFEHFIVRGSQSIRLYCPLAGA